MEFMRRNEILWKIVMVSMILTIALTVYCQKSSVDEGNSNDKGRKHPKTTAIPNSPKPTEKPAEKLEAKTLDKPIKTAVKTETISVKPTEQNIEGNIEPDVPHRTLLSNEKVELEMYERQRAEQFSEMTEFQVEVNDANERGLKTDAVELDWLKKNELQFSMKGGRLGSMSNFNPRHVVAVIIPIRSVDRPQLAILLRNLMPILQEKEDLHLRVFVVEQTDARAYNPGALMNIGYREAMRLFHFTCFVFHPVHILPMSSRNVYGCEHSPMQLAVNHVSESADPFARVEMMSEEDFRTINGYPNNFAGMHGAQESLHERAKELGLPWHRTTEDIGKFRTQAIAPSSSLRVHPTLNDQVKHATQNQQDNGLSSLSYKLESVRNRDLFTLVNVSFDKNKEEL